MKYLAIWIHLEKSFLIKMISIGIFKPTRSRILMKTYDLFSNTSDVTIS